MKLRTAVFILAAMLCGHTATAQTSQRRHPIRSKVVWTLVGAAVGTAIGAYAVWDDDERAAVLQDRMRRSMIIGGSVGGALGFWFGHHRSRVSLNPDIRSESPPQARVRAVAAERPVDAPFQPFAGHPLSLIAHPKSLIPNPSSRIPDRESLFPDSRSPIVASPMRDSR